MPFPWIAIAATALVGLVAGSAVTKSAAHSWAKSNLRKQREETLLLRDRLESERTAAERRVADLQAIYAGKIKDYQEKRNRELQEYINFLNQTLGDITEYYIPRLEHFQKLMFDCVASWMPLDLCQQNTKIIFQEFESVTTARELYEAYIRELQNLSQRQKREEWRAMIEKRELTVNNAFIGKTIESTEGDFVFGVEKFEEEIHKLQSASNLLRKECASLFETLKLLGKDKKLLAAAHEENKQKLTREYDICIEFLYKLEGGIIANYYTSEIMDVYPSGNNHADRWLKDLAASTSWRAIKSTRRSIMQDKRETITSAVDKVRKLDEQFSLYNDRIQETIAANAKRTIIEGIMPIFNVSIIFNGGFNSDALQKDKAQCAKLDHLRQEARNLRQIAFEAQDIINPFLDFEGLLEELKEHIEKLSLLHPDKAIEQMRKMFGLKNQISTWHLLGVNTKQEKREHWAKKHDAKN